jgi:hypothetical protein
MNVYEEINNLKSAVNDIKRMLEPKEAARETATSKSKLSEALEGASILKTGRNDQPRRTFYIRTEPDSKIDIRDFIRHLRNPPNIGKGIMPGEEDIEEMEKMFDDEIDDCNTCPNNNCHHHPAFGIFEDEEPASDILSDETIAVLEDIMKVLAKSTHKHEVFSHIAEKYGVAL